MLKIETIREIRNLLLNERMTYKGNEIARLIQIVGELNAEELEVIKTARVKAAPPPPEKPNEQ